MDTGYEPLLIIAASVAVATVPSAFMLTGNEVGTVTLNVAAPRVTLTGALADPVDASTLVSDTVLSGVAAPALIFKAIAAKASVPQIFCRDLFTSTYPFSCIRKETKNSLAPLRIHAKQVVK